MSKLEEAKETVLTAICAMQTDKWQAEVVKTLADTYSTLVHAEVQLKMTEWQTRDCNCPQCRDGLDDEVIG